MFMLNMTKASNNEVNVFKRNSCEPKPQISPCSERSVLNSFFYQCMMSFWISIYGHLLQAENAGHAHKGTCSPIPAAVGFGEGRQRDRSIYSLFQTEAETRACMKGQHKIENQFFEL